MDQIQSHSDPNIPANLRTDWHITYYMKACENGTGDRIRNVQLSMVTIDGVNDGNRHRFPSCFPGADKMLRLFRDY